MQNCNRNEPQIITGIRRIAYVTALGIALTSALPLAAYAQSLAPPSVPAGLEVEAPSEVFLLGHGVGTQNYVSAFCFSWTRRLDVVHSAGHVVQ